jgi:hypothetical protein
MSHRTQKARRSGPRPGAVRFEVTDTTIPLPAPASHGATYADGPSPESAYGSPPTSATPNAITASCPATASYPQASA